MMATLAELVQRVKDLLDDGALTDQVLIAYLNDAQLELAQVSRERTVWDVAVAAGAVSVDRPTGALVLQEVYFDYSSTREELEFRGGYPPEPTDDTGIPERVYVLGGKLYFYPVPSVDGTLHVVGISRPTDMANFGDTPSVQDADSVLVAYAAWMTALATGDQRASSLERLYQQRRVEWMARSSAANPLARHMVQEDWYPF